MLFKTAAYLVAFTMILLFATSEAAIDMNRGKDTVRKLLTRFINTVVDHKSIDLKSLTSTAQSLLNDQPFVNYLDELAQDRGNCSSMGADINTYRNNFRKLLTGPGSSSSQRATSSAQDWMLNEAGVPYGIDEKIPMNAKLDLLQKTCATQGSSQSTPSRRHQTYTSLRELMKVDRAESDEVKKRPTDKRGFNIEQGKLDVKTVLDALLQLALDKKCTQIKHLRDFANSLLHDNAILYQEIFKAVPQNAQTVLRNIDEYVRDSWRIQLQGRVSDVELIPMKEMIRAIRRQCVAYLAYIFNPEDIPEDPMEDIIQKRGTNHWPRSG